MEYKKSVSFYSSFKIFRMDQNEVRVAFNKFPDFFFCTGIQNCCRLLKIQYVIAIHLMRWLTNFYDFGFKSAAVSLRLTDLALPWLVLMALFCAAIRRDSVFHLRFPFLRETLNHVFSCWVYFFFYLLSYLLFVIIYIYIYIYIYILFIYHHINSKFGRVIKVVVSRPFWKWTREEHKQMDQKTIKLMTMHKATE